MRTKEQVLLSIKDSGMVAVVRGETSDKAIEIVEKCIEGGIKAIELTFTVPYAHRVIEDISRKYGDSIILGAGTVLDSETARIALLSGAEFIESPHFNPEVTRLCNRYRKASMAGILTMPGFDASLAEGVMLLTPFSVNSEDAATQSFVKTYTEKYGVEPNQFAADAYDGVYIVKAALEKAGCTADMSSTDICEALIQVMPTLSVDGLTGKAMTWNAEGEVSKAPLAAVIENGEYVMK